MVVARASLQTYFGIFIIVLLIIMMMMMTTMTTTTMMMMMMMMLMDECSFLMQKSFNVFSLYACDNVYMFLRCQDTHVHYIFMYMME